MRCPRCGSGRLFRRWLMMHPDCPRCGHHFEVEQGYWLGAVMINTGLTQGLFILVLVLGIVVTWPQVPWVGLLVAGVAVAVLAPITLHPFSRTVWVALERHARKWSTTDQPSPIQVRRVTESSDETVE